MCTKTTAPFVIPGASVQSLPEMARRVSIFAKGLVGGSLTVGDLKDRPTQDAVAYHLLCDGSTISRTQYPELVEFLNPGEDTATLPDYSGALTISTPTVTQTTDDGGTVSTGGTVTDVGDTGGTTGGNVLSGGRVPRIAPGGDIP